jgi:lysophospholipase L1-like esterase
MHSKVLSAFIPTLLLFCVNVAGQTNPNFTLAMENPTLSLGVGGSATVTMQVKAVAAYNQPVYLIPSSLPAGVSLEIPTPVVGSQAVTIKIRASSSAQLQSFSVTIYGASSGETHSSSFSIAILEARALPPPEAPPVILAPVNLPASDVTLPSLPVAAMPQTPTTVAPVSAARHAVGSHWVGSWGASAVTPTNESGAYYLTNVTVRQIVRLSVGSPTGLRIKLSNALGKEPVTLGSVHVAQWAGDSAHLTSAIVPITDQIVKFGGSGTIMIPAGAEVFSDPVSFPSPAGVDLAVSFYIPKSSNVPATVHTFGNQTTYFALGDSAASTVLSNAFTDTVRPYLTGVDVDADGASALVALGDSLTDGMLSSLNQNARWTDDLARRLHDAYGDEVGVVNKGIAGNCVVMECMGPSGIERFNRDVLGVSNVRYLVVLEGLNDIGNAPNLTVDQLTDAYRSMIVLAHAQGISVYGATIPPFGGSNYYSPAHEKFRQQLNTFIRSGGAFDGVIDFDKAIANPANRAYLLPQYVGDKIRPNDAGYKAMADAFDLALLNPAIR